MRKLFLMLFLAFTSVIFAQEKLKFESGNLDFLKGQTEVNVELLKFENATFQVENFSEATYLERRKTETIESKGESVWEEWISNWEKFKDVQYKDYFIKGVNEKSKSVKFVKDGNTKYTLIIETKWIYAGWSTGFVYQPAKLTSVLTFVETENPSNIILKIDGDKVEGKVKNKILRMEYGRIASSFESTGKELAKLINAASK